MSVPFKISTSNQFKIDEVRYRVGLFLNPTFELYIIELFVGNITRILLVLQLIKVMRPTSNIDIQSTYLVGDLGYSYTFNYYN